jgi:hypothetical protein
MEKAQGIVKHVLFQVNWLLWTPSKRYTYLWQRTCGRPYPGRRGN